MNLHDCVTVTLSAGAQNTHSPLMSSLCAAPHEEDNGNMSPFSP